MNRFREDEPRDLDAAERLLDAVSSDAEVPWHDEPAFQREVFEHTLTALREVHPKARSRPQRPLLLRHASIAAAALIVFALGVWTGRASRTSSTVPSALPSVSAERMDAPESEVASSFRESAEQALRQDRDPLRALRDYRAYLESSPRPDGQMDWLLTALVDDRSRQ